MDFCPLHNKNSRISVASAKEVLKQKDPGKKILKEVGCNCFCPNFITHQRKGGIHAIYR